MNQPKTDNQPKSISWMTRAKMALAGAVLAGAAFGVAGMAAPPAEPVDEEAGRLTLTVDAKGDLGGGGVTHGMWATWS